MADEIVISPEDLAYFKGVLKEDGAASIDDISQTDAQKVALAFQVNAEMRRIANANFTNLLTFRDSLMAIGDARFEAVDVALGGLTLGWSDLVDPGPAASAVEAAATGAALKAKS